MSFENEFDLSNVTLKELQDIQCVISEEYLQINQAIQVGTRSGQQPTPEIHFKRHSMDTYANFLNKAIQIKIIDEMNKTYFGSKITLKNKLPQAEVVEESLLAGIRVAGVGKYFGEEHVEYEPLFPVMP